MEWTAIKDQLPQEGKVVLLCDQGGYMTAGWLDNGRFYFESMVWFQHEFTHWMPLPEPPKELQHYTGNGISEQFYCADWNRCGSICEEQCDACSKAENMPESIFIETNPLIKACCIYCKQGYNEKHPTLFRVCAPGEYWQHWNFENIGCDENINNISPNGDAVKRQPPKL